MKLGEFELDNIYNVDCYEAIKSIPDKSVDLIYTDIPYDIEDNGNCVRSVRGKWHKFGCSKEFGTALSWV